MNPEFLARAPEMAVRKNRERAWKRRARDWDDATDFLYQGDEDGRHAARCPHRTTCQRVYDPSPRGAGEPEAVMYEGTGIGALFGMDGSDHHLWQLAGWTLGKGGL